MVEQHQVLVNLPHIAHVRNDSQAELSRQYADRDELRDAGYPRAVDLHNLHSRSLHEILEHDSVRNVLTQGNWDRLDRLCKGAVRANIVWVGRLFYKKRSHLPKLLAHFECP